MLRYLLFILFVPFFQDQDTLLQGSWKMIEMEGDPVEENIILSFYKDYHFELVEDDEPEKGKWRVISGSKELLLSLKMDDEETENIFTMRFSGDSLFLDMEGDEAIFLRQQ